MFRCALLIACLLCGSSTFAASFDCKLARTPREHAICASPELSAKDSQLAAAYTQLRARLSPAGAALVQTDQRAWLAYLDLACPANGKGDAANMSSCLANEYSNRLSDLKPQPSLLSGNRVFTHHVAIIAAGKLDANDPHNPGFGTGSFSVPQIDSPSAQQQSFNTAVLNAVIRESSNDPKKPATSLQDATDNESTTEVTYDLGGHNARLIVVNFQIFEMGYGAAHPSTQLFTFNWWLDSGHELQATDVFRADTPWKTALVAPAIAKLRADPDIRDMLWKGEELTKGVADGLARPRAWTVSRDGLTVTYGSYGVAAYVAGMPVVHFTWKDLQPYLNPALHPETLPTVKPPAS